MAEQHTIQLDLVTLDKTLFRANRQGNPRTQYLVTYRFTSATGEEIDGTAELPVEEWERLEPGQTFPVTYLPDKPDSSRPRRWSSASSAAPSHCSAEAWHSSMRAISSELLMSCVMDS